MNKQLKSVSLLLLLPIFISSALFAQEQKNCAGFHKAKNKTYVIAHRGAHIGIPENTLPAYQKAIDLGCDFVEIDARTTKDNQFVSVHNAAVDNYVSGIKGRVNEMTLKELKALDIGSQTGEKWKETRIPTFEEILQLCRGKIGIYLDLKDAPVEELMKIIRKYNMEKDIIWYIPANYLLNLEGVGNLFGNSFPMPDPRSEENLENVLNTLKPCVVATDMGTLSEQFVQKAHEHGVLIFVDENKGTVAEWEQIIRWGTDGIQTDNPEKLIEYLQHKKTH